MHKMTLNLNGLCSVACLKENLITKIYWNFNMSLCLFWRLKWLKRGINLRINKNLSEFFLYLDFNTLEPENYWFRMSRNTLYNYYSCLWNKYCQNLENTCNSYSSLLYFPYSTMPPKTSNLVPSTTNPYAAHPGGTSPFVTGTNHWFVAEDNFLI